MRKKLNRDERVESHSADFEQSSWSDCGDLSFRLRVARLARGLKQVELAKLAEVSQVSIALWETRRSRPSMGNLVKVAAALGVKVGWLCGSSGSPVG